MSPSMAQCPSGLVVSLTCVVKFLSSRSPGPVSGLGTRATVTVTGRARICRCYTLLPRIMENEIAQLVSEVFACKQARDIQQEQLVRDNAAAVREAVLAHVCPHHLHADASFASGCGRLSAGSWKRLSSVLAGLMPIFWFGVIKGLWGSVKVIAHSSNGCSAVMLRCNFVSHSTPRLLASRVVAAACHSSLGRVALIRNQDYSAPSAASREWADGPLRKWRACTATTRAYCRTRAWSLGGAQSCILQASMPAAS